MAAAQGRGAYKLNGAAAHGAAAAEPPAALTFERLLEVVRRAQEHSSIGAALAAAGAALVAAGAAWGTYRLFAANAHLLCILLGLVSLTCSLVLRPGGLLACLPEGVQDLLLRRTLFDLLHDDSAIQNLVRRWGRVLVLCLGGAGLAPGEVKAVVAGLDPTFVDTVLRRTFFWYLPAPVRTVLLPAGASSEQQPAGAGAGAAEPQGSEGKSLAAAAGEGAGSAGLPADLGGPPLTPQRIVEILKERDQARACGVTEPGLAPAIDAVIGVRPVLLRIGSLVLQRAWGMLSVASACLGASALLLGAPPLREFLLNGVTQGLALCGSTRALRSLSSPNSRALASRAAGVCAALGALGAGAAVATAAAMRRLAQMREELPQKPASEAELPTSGDGVDILKKRVQELEVQLTYQQDCDQMQHLPSLWRVDGRMVRRRAAQAPQQASPSSSASTSASAPVPATSPPPATASAAGTPPKA